MSIIPTPYTVAHIARRPDPTQKDLHGNPIVPPAVPVLRKVQSFAQGASNQPFTTETVNRDEEEIRMAVPNPEVYESGDQVLLWGTVTNGMYTGGVAYWVDGKPSDARKGPWPRYTRHFGGVVKLRRIT